MGELLRRRPIPVVGEASREYLTHGSTWNGRNACSRHKDRLKNHAEPPNVFNFLEASLTFLGN